MLSVQHLLAVEFTDVELARDAKLAAPVEKAGPMEKVLVGRSGGDTVG